MLIFVNNYYIIMCVYISLYIYYIVFVFAALWAKECLHAFCYNGVLKSAAGKVQEEIDVEINS